MASREPSKLASTMSGKCRKQKMVSRRGETLDCVLSIVLSTGCKERWRTTRAKNRAVARKNDVLRSAGARKKSIDSKNKDATATRKTGS